MPEKELDKFEQIIQSEVSDLDLDNLLVSGNVSEVVGEAISEKIPKTGKKKKTQKTGFAQISQSISDLLFKSDDAHTSKKIPSDPAIQQKEVKKAVVKKTRKLIDKATKYQNQKNFSADKLERMLLEIRNLQKILSDLLTATADKLEHLYRKFVLKEG